MKKVVLMSVSAIVLSVSAALLSVQALAADHKAKAQAQAQAPHLVIEAKERWAAACYSRHTGELRVLFVGNRVKPGKVFKCSPSERVIHLVYVLRR